MIRLWSSSPLGIMCLTVNPCKHPFNLPLRPRQGNQWLFLLAMIDKYGGVGTLRSMLLFDGLRSLGYSTDSVFCPVPAGRRGGCERAAGPGCRPQPEGQRRLDSFGETRLANNEKPTRFIVLPTWRVLLHFTDLNWDLRVFFTKRKMQEDAS